ncbi:hypothetical protein Lser_V15G40523 [Lactuca serriola]
MDVALGILTACLNIPELKEKDTKEQSDSDALENNLQYGLGVEFG